MALRVYNTLSREKEDFAPLDPPRVGMYVCGPTVYGHSHLGHAKSYISFDVILRYLRFSGYKVTYVQNITDVGHLTEDTEGMADEGEDKVIAEARRRRQHPMQVVETYTRSYFEDMDALNIIRPDISPRATGHVPEQIELVEKLIERSHAYVADGNVYFDISSWPAYGKLSRRKVEEMEAGARVAVSGDKRHPADFSLWKKAEPDHIMQWPSPWGRGYPGWHLECSVMSMKYLGDSFDIHGGGLENAFPHHECEIAQAEAGTGRPFVKYWLHHNMLTVDGQKMGKALGNFITLKQLFSGEHERLEHSYDPLAVRQFVLSSHYRSTIDFSNAALQAAESGFARLRDAVLITRDRAGSDGEVTGAITERLADVRRRFVDAMDDDFNTAAALAVLFELARDVTTWAEANTASPADWTTVAESFKTLGGGVLGIVPDVYPGQAGDDELVDKLMGVVIDARAEARQAKQFTIADRIRAQLGEIGMTIEDRPDGTTWKRS